MEEQRNSKQVALVENEHLRMEVEALRSANVANVGAQIGYKEADSEYSSVFRGISQVLGCERIFAPWQIYFIVAFLSHLTVLGHQTNVNIRQR